MKPDTTYEGDAPESSKKMKVKKIEACTRKGPAINRPTFHFLL